MNNLWQRFSLKTKLFVVLFGLSTLITLSVSVSLYKQIRTDYYELIRQELVTLALIAANQIDGDELQTLQHPSQQASALYTDTKKTLSAISNKSPMIKYIYTMRKTENPRQLSFIVDADPDPLSAAALGEIYDIEAFPEMLPAFTAPTVDQLPTIDKWGSKLSGYAPIYNSAGVAIAIVGVDVSTDKVVAALDTYKEHMLGNIMMSLLMAAFISLLLASSFTGKLNRLNCAVDEMASGNLSVNVPIEGQDEVADLAARLSRLAVTIDNDKEKLLLATIEGLVNALEAKDSYTFGHSAEVATITYDICKQIGLPENDIFLIYFAAILHDIGKIGIPDSVLNKQGPLTDSEWDLVKQHPLVGSRIIAGIPGLSKVAEIVLHHHARYDGKGYPEPLKGIAIPIGSRIIAVADSFQAMTSNRSYRRGLPRKTALAEIKRCAGTQFDPIVVDAFLKIRG